MSNAKIIQVRIGPVKDFVPDTIGKILGNYKKFLPTVVDGVDQAIYVGIMSGSENYMYENPNDRETESFVLSEWAEVEFQRPSLESLFEGNPFDPMALDFVKVLPPRPHYLKDRLELDGERRISFHESMIDSVMTYLKKLEEINPGYTLDTQGVFVQAIRFRDRITAIKESVARS